MRHRDARKRTPEDVLQALGERIRAERLNNDWTVAELADRAGLHRNSVARLEAGTGGSLDSAVRVVLALGLTDVLAALTDMPTLRPEVEGRQRATPRSQSVSRRGFSWGDDS